MTRVSGRYDVPQMDSLGGDGWVLTAGGAQSQAGFVTDEIIDWSYDYALSVVVRAWVSSDPNIDVWLHIAWGDYGLTTPNAFTERAYFDICPSSDGNRINITPDVQPRWQDGTNWAKVVGATDAFYAGSHNSYWDLYGYPGETTPCRFACVISMHEHCAPGSHVQLGFPGYPLPGDGGLPVGQLEVNMLRTVAWNYGDGTIDFSLGDPVTHAYSAPGTCDVSAEVSDYQNQQLRTAILGAEIDITGGVTVPAAPPLSTRLLRSGSFFGT